MRWVCNCDEINVHDTKHYESGGCAGWAIFGGYVARDAELADGQDALLIVRRRKLVGGQAPFVYAHSADSILVSIASIA